MSIKISIENHDKYLSEVLKNVDEQGYLRHRESTSLEYKENFNMGSKSAYTKTMVGFANNVGGYILFGVKNSPRIPLGVNKIRFDEIKEEQITSFLVDHFEPEVRWDLGVINAGGKDYGYIYVYESEEKPIICSKSATELVSGDIYYRYRAQDRKIAFPELKKIMNDNQKKERDAWVRSIENISKIGPNRVAMIDLITGAIEADKMEGSKLIIDKKLLSEIKDKVKFVKEGHFSDTGGEPTLKLIGEVQAVNGVIVPDVDLNKDYPYIQKSLAEELNVKPYQAQALIWKYKVKGNKKYHVAIETSKSGHVHKYSKALSSHLINILNKKKNKEKFLSDISKEYQITRKSKKTVKNK